MNIDRIFVMVLAIALIAPISAMANEIKVQAGKVKITSNSDGSITVNTGSTQISVPPHQIDEDLELEEWESELWEENENAQYQYSSCNGETTIQSNQQTSRTTGSGKVVIQRSVSRCP